jgi:hypothetical protein
MTVAKAGDAATEGGAFDRQTPASRYDKYRRIDQNRAIVAWRCRGDRQCIVRAATITPPAHRDS